MSGVRIEVAGLEEFGSQNAEVGKKELRIRKSELGPVVVPEGRDYAAAGMRKTDDR